eukprot:CAMPEP_0179170474 /NCGR_PEP_ID=MMETSP0796-20121207/83982_1 /TAXON_ID=73915 /ORGANISM="Pyrodinium bahamense, Strain pbaha01" /LENGTH=61 /DNA_ID=CAMNT_0020873453 /DNA_START=35 /DNA_END=217 /DNA_ORIENTATION=-
MSSDLGVMSPNTGSESLHGAFSRIWGMRAAQWVLPSTLPSRRRQWGGDAQAYADADAGRAA